jgi:hypothetical protein
MKKNKKKTLLDSYIQERKTFAFDVTTKVFKDKKKYNRKDKSWKYEDD